MFPVITCTRICWHPPKNHEGGVGIFSYYCIPNQTITVNSHKIFIKIGWLDSLYMPGQTQNPAATTGSTGSDNGPIRALVR